MLWGLIMCTEMLHCTACTVLYDYTQLCCHGLHQLHVHSNCLHQLTLSWQSDNELSKWRFRVCTVGVHAVVLIPSAFQHGCFQSLSVLSQASSCSFHSLWARLAPICKQALALHTERQINASQNFHLCCLQGRSVHMQRARFFQPGTTWRQYEMK